MTTVPRVSGSTVWSLRLALLCAAVLLGAGLSGPCMAIEPSFGKLDGWVRLLKPSMVEPTRYSVFGGIDALIHNGSPGIGILLLLFSVIFPAAKLATMAGAISSLAAGRAPGLLMKLAHHAGKFSMLDVFVAGLFVLAVKGLPGDTKVTLGWGVGAFGASVILSLIAALVIAHLERRLEKGSGIRG
jgi:paraquat-inducible protein A